MKYYVGQSLRVKSRYVFNPDIKIGDIGTITSVYRDGKGVSIKFPNAGAQSCTDADRYLEPIALSTGDMINALMATPEVVKYKSQDDYIMQRRSKGADILMLTYGGKEVEHGGNISLTDQWTLVEEIKEVTFLEAVKALNEDVNVSYEFIRCDGARVKHVFNNKNLLVSNMGWIIDASAILGSSGKWTVEE